MMAAMALPDDRCHAIAWRANLKTREARAPWCDTSKCAAMHGLGGGGGAALRERSSQRVAEVSNFTAHWDGF